MTNAQGEQHGANQRDPGAAALRIVGGKVARFWGFLDPIGLLHQPNRLPASAETR